MRNPNEIKINGITLDVILAEHLHWINKDCKNWENMRAYLRDANLCGANLYNANLCGANLCDANLYNAYLRDVNLRDAYLCGANLQGANLYGANLCDADLRGANMYGANLCGAEGSLIEYRKGRVVTSPITGYKKCKHGIIVTLEIPRGAIVFSINGDKCRTNKAKVIAINGADRAYSIHNYMSYYVGDEITIYDFDCQYNEECSTGLHFFMTREEAENYS